MTHYDSFPRLAVDYIGRTLFATLGMAVVFAMFTSLWLGMITVQADTDLIGFAVLGIVGWALYFGQEIVLGSLSDEDDGDTRFAEGAQAGSELLADRTWDERIGLLLMAIVYYSSIVMVGALVASIAGTFFGPASAFMVAFIWPTWETVSAAVRSPFPIPLSFWGFAAFTLWVLQRLFGALNSVRVDRFRVDRLIPELIGARDPRLR